MNITFKVTNKSKPSGYDGTYIYTTNSVTVNITGIPARTRTIKWGYSYGSKQFSDSAIYQEVQIVELSSTHTIDIESQYLPTSASTTFTYYVKCYYSDGSTAASKTNKVTVTMPDWVKPAISSFTLTPFLLSDGFESQYGYVQNRTKIELRASANGSSSNCKVTSMYCKCPMIGFYKTLNPNQISCYTTQQTGAITASGSCQATVTVTDARGRSASKTITFTSQAYHTPSVTSLVVNRCTSSGVISTNGTYAKVKAVFAPCSLTGKTNSCTAKVYYKINGQSGYTEYGSITSNTYTGAMGNGSFDMAHTHSIKLVVTDTIGGVTTKYINVLGTSYIIDVLNGGTGLGIGCEAAAQNQLDIGYATVFRDTVTIGHNPSFTSSIYMKNNTYLCWENSNGTSSWQIGLSSGNNAHLFSQNNYSGSLNIGHSANSGTFITGKGGSNITLTSDGKNQIYSKAIYDRTYSSGATVTVTEYGTLGRISSASKYKLDIRDIQEEAAYPYRILNLKLKQWFDKASCERYSEYLSNENSKPEIGCGIDSIYGLIAEDVEKAGLSKYCLYNPEGKIEGIQYERLWTLLIPIVDQNNRDIKKLLDIVKAQQEKIDTLTR